MLLLENNKLWLSRPLLRKYNVPEGTIDYHTNTSNTWKVREDQQGVKFFLYDSLTPKVVEKLPSKSNLLAMYYQTAYKSESENLAISFEILKTKHWGKYYNLIGEKYTLPMERRTEFAQKWAVWAWICENYSRGEITLVNIVEAYNKVFPGHISSEHSFCNFLRKCRENGIEEAIIDKRAITKAQPRITEFQFSFLRAVYMDSRKFSARQAHDKLVLACHSKGEKPYNLSSVKLYFKKLSHDIEAYCSRYGSEAAAKQMPYATFLPAKSIHDQWQIDGWTLPFFDVNLNRHVLFVVMDNHSRKIIGAAVGESENTALILEGLDDAMRRTGYIAYEIRSDAHSFHRTKDAARLKATLDEMGIKWDVSRNANSKAILERSFQYLDAFCKDYKCYIGKGVLSKNKDARRSPEAMAELVKPENRLTNDEIKVIAASIIERYNNGPLPSSLNGLTPQQAYDNSQSENGIKVTESERIRLVNPTHIIKVLRGQITIKRGTAKHEFQLPAHLASRYNNTHVEVTFHDLYDGIYISDVTTGEFVATLSPKPVIHGAAANRTEQDEKYLNQLTGRKKGIRKQTGEAAKKALDMLLLKNSDAANYIEPHLLPKEIAQEIQNRDTRLRAMDMGAKENMLPVRMPVQSIVSAQKAIKDKSSPYAPANHEPKIFDINSFLNPGNE